MNPLNPPLVPFVIAATGHRDLRPQDVEPLQNETRIILQKMLRRMPNTPLIMLNGLAEGADQLIAEIGLELGISVVAVLPMPVDIYTAQMSEPAKVNFARLLELSAFQIPLQHPSAGSAEIAASEATRAECYDILAQFLVHHSQALIALWDGQPSDKPGGTASVVQYVLSGIPQTRDSGHEPIARVVYQVVTPRAGASTAAPVIASRLLSSRLERHSRSSRKHGTGMENFNRTPTARIEDSIERFNKLAVKGVKPPGEGRLWLLPADYAHRPLPPFLARLELLFSGADAISGWANKLRAFLFYTILGTAVVGTLAYALHADILADSAALGLVFPALICLSLLIHRFARALHVDDIYLDARSLAEALRVQFFWELAGVREPVDRHYLVHHRTEMDWIRAALRNIWLLRLHSEKSTPSGPGPVDVSGALRFWVLHQAQWYRARAFRQAGVVRRRENLSQIALWAALGWSCLIPVSLLLPRSWGLGPWQDIAARQPWSGILQFALALPPLLAGGYRLWTEQAGYEEQARQYHYMAHELDRKYEELKISQQDPQRLQQLLLATGIEALKENGQWLLLHRERPLQVLGSP
jgi:hypothetical protein